MGGHAKAGNALVPLQKIRDGFWCGTMSSAFWELSVQVFLCDY